MAFKKSGEGLTPFAWAESVSWHKVDVMTHLNCRDYNIFMTNRILAMNKIFIAMADFADAQQFSDNFMHYQFLRHVLEKPQRKPFSKFVKAEKPSEEVSMVADYYQCNTYVAQTYLNRLNEKELERIHAALNPEKGGAGKRQRVKKS